MPSSTRTLKGAMYMVLMDLVHGPQPGGWKARRIAGTRQPRAPATPARAAGRPAPTNTTSESARGKSRPPAEARPTKATARPKTHSLNTIEVGQPSGAFPRARSCSLAILLAPDDLTLMRTEGVTVSGACVPQP